MGPPLVAFWFIWNTSHAHIEVEQHLFSLQYRLVFCFPLLAGAKMATAWDAELQRRERDE